MQTSLPKYWLLGLFSVVARSLLIGTGQKSICDMLASGSCPTKVGYIVFMYVPVFITRTDLSDQCLLHYEK